MWRAIPIALAMITACMLVWGYFEMQVTTWDGWFDLTVRIETGSVRPRAISCQAFGREENAREVLAHPILLEPNLWSATAEPFDGSSFTVHVALSGRSSAIGREITRHQHRYLVVIATWPDGRRTGMLVSIPDCRESREVTAVFP